MNAIDKIAEAGEQRTIEEIKQYQPDTRNDFFGKGPEAWHSTSYIRQQEIYGANMVAMINQGQKKTKVVKVDSVEDIINSIEKYNSVELKLDKDLTVTSSINIPEGKEIKVNLQGQTVTANNETAFTVNGGKLTIENGSITGSKRAVVVSNGGEAIVESGVYTTTSAGQVMNAQGKDSKITVNGGTFNSQECGIMPFDGAEIIVNDGIFNTIDNFAIGTNGTAGRGQNIITINKATLNCNIETDGYEACGIYIANNDKVIVGKDVVINVVNGCGILMRAGQVEVKNGAKINVTTDKGNDFTGWVGDNKTKMNQSGIIYHESANYPGKEGMSLTVEDGITIDAISHSVEILSDEISPNVNIGTGNYNPSYPEQV